MPNQNSPLLNGNECPAKTGIISTKHYDSLISELKCPGCAKPLKLPIKLCETGHSVCNYCTTNLPSCPICAGGVTEMRSLTLESLVTKAHFGCSNAKRGCTVRMPMDLMQWHKKRCLYNIGDCFMGKVWGGCEWTGCEINWIQHCDENHNDKIFEESEIILQTRYERFKNTTETVIGFFILKVFNEIFNLYQVYDKKHMMMLWTLICTSKTANKHKSFYYEIELFSPAEASRLIMQRNFCHAENDEDVLIDGRCISFTVSDLMKYLDSDKALHYRFKIKEILDLDQSISNQTINSNRPSLTQSHSVDEAHLVKFPPNTPPNITPSLFSKSVGDDDPFNFSQVSGIARFDQDAVNQKRKMFQQNMMKKNLSMDENDSIDKEIAENIDLKKVLIKEFTIDKHSNEIVVKSPNAVPKPPRQMSVNSSAPDEESILSYSPHQDKKTPASVENK